MPMPENSKIIAQMFNNLFKEIRPRLKGFGFTGHVDEDSEYAGARPPYVVVNWSIIEVCYFWVDDHYIRVRSCQMYYNDPRVESKIDLQDPTVSIVDRLVELIEFYDENLVQEIRLNDECRQEYLNCECGIESKPLALNARIV